MPVPRSRVTCVATSLTRVFDRGPRLEPPVAIGLSASGRPMNQRGPVQAWPIRAEPLLVSDPLA